MEAGRRGAFPPCAGGSLVGGFTFAPKAGFSCTMSKTHADPGRPGETMGSSKGSSFPSSPSSMTGAWGTALWLTQAAIPLGPGQKLIRSAAEEVQALLERTRLS